MAFRCSAGLHTWRTVEDTGKTRYQECATCGKRRALQRAGGYQPIDRDWLAGGAFFDPATVTFEPIHASRSEGGPETMTSPVIELGNGGGSVEITGKTGKPGEWGLIWYHTRPDNGEPCGGCLSWDTADTTHWTLVSREPLTLSPSLNCTTCGRHGFIENSKWRPA